MAEFNTYGGDSAAKEREFLAQIESIDAQMDGYYAGLGRKYMEIHHDNFEDALSKEAGLIIDAEKQKIACRKGILSLKGRTLCDNCGSELPEDAVFCGFCGYKMPEPKIDIPDGQIRCACCGAIQPEGVKFCMNCGEPIAVKTNSGDDDEIFDVKEPVPEVPDDVDANDAGSVEKAPEPEVEKPKEEVPVDEPPTDKPPVDDGLKDEPVPPYYPPVTPASKPEDKPLFCTNCGNRLDPDAMFCSECGFKCG